MQIGAQYQGDHRGPKAFARRVEAAGFDSVWAGDHVGHLGDGIATLGCFAGVTEQITIGLNLLVLPWRPAAVVAKAMATISLVAPGRVVAGFGVGGEFPAEFSATGADLHRRGAYSDDALELIGKLWTGEPVTHSSPWAELDGFRLEPVPVRPEVWIGGRSEAALRRAVRFGDGYVPYLVSPGQFAKRRLRLLELAAEAGRPMDGFRFGCLASIIPAANVEEATEIGLRGLKLSGLTPEAVRGMYLLGDDDSILARMQEYADAGVDHLIIGCMPGDDRELEAFYAACRRLLPAARALRARTGGPGPGIDG